MLSEWGKGFTKDFNKKIEFSRRRMERLKNRTDPASIMAFGEAQKQYLNILNTQSDYGRQRAKVSWYKYGDANTKFFHNVVKGRQKLNRMEKLKDDNGVWRPKGPPLNELICDYFQNLFTSSPGDMDDILECIDRKIIDVQNATLTRQVSFEEVKSAVFSMQQDKSPGPDGLNPGFYQAYWDILGTDLVQFCNSIISSEKLPGGVNFTHLVLIPKKKEPEVMGT